MIHVVCAPDSPLLSRLQRFGPTRRLDGSAARAGAGDVVVVEAVGSLERLETIEAPPAPLLLVVDGVEPAELALLRRSLTFDYVPTTTSDEELALRLDTLHAGARRSTRDWFREERGRQAIPAQLSRAVETMQIGLTITDMDGVILYTNPAEAAMHGYTVDELLGRDVRVLSPRSLWRPLAPDQVRRIRSWDRESINVTQAGRLFPVRILSDVVSAGDGTAIGVVTTCRDITAEKRLEFELRRSRAELERRVEERTLELRLTSAHLESVREDERARLAREIHDELGQLLTGLRLELDLARAHAGNAATAMHENLANFERILDQTIATSRQIVAELRPRLLDEVGLAAGLEWLVGRSSSSAGLDIELVVQPEDPRLSEQMSIAVFRIAQEALTNIAKHAAARRVRMALVAGADQIELSIADDGAGFDPTNRTAGHGLAGMRERARLLGGTLHVDTAPAAGCRIAVTFPLGLGNRDRIST